MAKIIAGLQVSDLYIDFDSLENPFYLFIGANGTGKTSILHSIHPFAYNASVGDSMSNAEFIADGQDGLKVITYGIDDGLSVRIYTITHNYTRSDSGTISVKSFISVDGEELNPSGTSGTFKEIIYDIFGLDEAYLGLLSLGNTVDNFVEFTGGVRKQLMIKIFHQIGIFNRYYKNASQNERNLKSVLTNVTTKLDKYAGFDKNGAKIVIYQLEQSIDALNEEVKSLTEKRGSITQKIQTNQEFVEEYNAKSALFLETVDKIDALKRKVNTSKDIPVLQNDIAQLDETINDKKIDKGSFELNLKNTLDYVQELKTDLTDTENTLTRMSSDVDLSELDTLKANLEAKLAGIDVPDDPILDKGKLVKSSIYLDELKAMCADFIAEVHYFDIIADTAKKYLKDSGLLSKSKKKYDDLVTNLQRQNYIKNANAVIGADAFEIKEYKCDDEKCPYKKFYEDYKLSVSIRTGELDKDMAKRQHDVDVAKDIITIGNIVSKMTKFISKNADIFDLPTDVFNPETFVDLYMDTREVANIDALTSLIDIAEKQEEKQALLCQLDDVDTKRKNNEALRGSFDSLEKRRDSIQSKLTRAKSSIEYYQQNIPSIDENINQLSKLKKDAEDAVRILQELEESRTLLSTLRTTLASMEAKSSEIDKMVSEQSTLSSQISEKEKELDRLRNDKESLNLTLNTVTSLENEQDTLRIQHAEAELIKNAVSPSKGVPLEHMKKFIKGDLINMVNELLEMVFQDELYINAKDVIINESEFTIPYRRRGSKVNDISMASDGEKAILGIAFSLSLARTTSNKYNILLLDEKDTTLDVYNRGKYIDIIDAYRKIIGCEQVFNITHNSMFDNYPVNIIMTSDIALTRHQTDNVLKLWR